MNEMTFVGTVAGKVRTVKRLTKIRARIVFDNGGTLFIVPNNTVPTNTPWTSAFEISKETHGSSFDTIINEFEYYNCNNEMGRYTAFYQQVQHPY